MLAGYDLWVPLDVYTSIIDYHPDVKNLTIPPSNFQFSLKFCLRSVLGKYKIFFENSNIYWKR